MLSIKTEMDLLLNILPSIDDDNQYASIASRIINLNESLKRDEKLSLENVGDSLRDPICCSNSNRTESCAASH